MEYSYDFHIHTGLSPCGDDEMTPNNIVMMSKLKGLDIIAITDHNTCGNAVSVIEAAQKTGLVVIPGMEVETAEACHMVLLFDCIEKAQWLEQIVQNALPPISNRPEIYGRQLYFNSKDEIIAQKEQLLVTSCTLSVYELSQLAQKLEAVFVAAHVDRDSYSLISNLGFFPEDLPVDLVEISKKDTFPSFLEKHKILNKYPLIHNSDAHYLGDISEREQFLPFCGTATEIIKQLRHLKQKHYFL